MGCLPPGVQISYKSTGLELCCLIEFYNFRPVFHLSNTHVSLLPSLMYYPKIPTLTERVSLLGRVKIVDSFETVIDF